MAIRTWQAVALPTVLAITVTVAGLPAGTRMNLGACSLAAGVAAFTLMAASALLGSRWGWVERVLGGLDKVYATHKWLGIWALVLASVHLVFKPGANGWLLAPMLELAPFWTRFLRQLSYVVLVFIVLLALNRRIPYSVWRWWHKLSGPLFLVVVAHWLSIKSPVTLSSPTGLWLAGWSAMGVAGALYKLLLYPLLARHSEYELVKAAHGPAGLHLTFVPVERPIAFKPGQFGFLCMKHDGLREPHPFTLASPADGHRVDLMVRALGDYTARLVAEARPGMRADIYAPHGHFSRPRGSRCEVWIAGGVGISPFIAWMQDAQAGGFDTATLFYCFTPGRAFPPPGNVDAMAGQCGIRLIQVKQGPDDPALAQGIEALCRTHGPDAVDIAFCGPAGLLDTVRGIMHHQGIPKGNLRHELFDFR